ncbi:uncharacterized protein CTRU02_210076 [Colletotrichum truncatum]|uniref:Uncharacterized protein n=1 Tax=Colletotrichum truncatum TaxID=5467 RepID=A0ACC3YU65_COLTU|nr:uncharacterized protein CTRU02_02652 [Colletotrichum truncatum]KAF6798678.1 hypothetical protein CTRU02_02652 [Colletotrichum truncatum]
MNFRPLLPAISSNSEGNPGGRFEKKRNPRKRMGFNACDGCRTIKCRCDGTRPSCVRCLKRRVECVYSADAKKEAAEVQKRQGDVLHLLRTAPEDQALDILRRLRRGGSPQTLPRSSVPQDGIGGRHQTVVQNSPVESVATSSTLEPQSTTDNDLSDSRSLPADTTKSSLNYVKSATLDRQQPTSSSKERIVHGENRLERLDINYWTTVPIQSRVGMVIISSYLQEDHPLWGYLNLDLFIRDLIEKRFEFCSPFLVNAMLLRTSETGSLLCLESSVRVALLRQTEMLWRAERSCHTVLNLAAILIFWRNLSSNDSNVTLVTGLLEDGRRMAERVQLFGAVDLVEVGRRFNALLEEWKKAYTLLPDESRVLNPLG